MIIFLFASLAAGCMSVWTVPETSSSPAVSETPTISPTASFTLPTVPHRPSPTLEMSDYAFPDTIDPAKPYLFYLHGKIIEDQGIPAISPDYGEYEYLAILKKLGNYGFVVISEPRSKNADSLVYARKTAEQVKTLLKAGVPERDITMVGASKGAGITIFVSDMLANSEINYVLMAICTPDTVDYFIQNRIFL